MFLRTALAAAVLFAGGLVITPDADAGGFRRARYNRAHVRTTNNFTFEASASAKRRVLYNIPSLNKNEYRRVFRQQAWYDYGFNGFSPFDFR